MGTYTVSSGVHNNSIVVSYLAKPTLNILNPLLFSMVDFMFINIKVKAEDRKVFLCFLTHRAIDDTE